MDGIDPMGLVFARWRRRASSALGAYGITFAQYQLIRLARLRGALSPSAAAEELGSDRPTMTLVARSCVGKGWLDRRASPGDKRSFRLSLSGQGEELLDRIEADRALGPQKLGNPLDILDSTERAELLRLLDRIERRSRDVL
jgi:MarR family transcriptional regulator for hemolysin